MKSQLPSPYRVIPYLGRRGHLHFIGDELYIKLCYRAYFKEWPNLESPRTYSEKLQWLKLHDHNPLYTKLVDKYEVKEWVSERIGNDYVVPTIGVWDHFDDIDFTELPERFVLKCTHDSGGLVICNDRNSFDVASAREKTEGALKRNFYWSNREWPYLDVPPRIIAEEYLEVKPGMADLADYKFFCFDGEPKAMFIATNRFGDGDTYFDFFDMNFEHLPFTNGHPNAPVRPEKPESFDEMADLARKLSSGITHVRVDFYEAKNGVFFGEMTFSHWAGFMPFEPNEWDEKFGSMIILKNEI